MKNDQSLYRKPPSIFRRIISFARALLITHAIVLVYAASIWGLAPHDGYGPTISAEPGFWFSTAIAMPLVVTSGTAICALLTNKLCAVSVFFCVLLCLTCAGLPFMTTLALAASAFLLFLAFLYCITVIFVIRRLLSQPSAPRPL